MVPVDVMPRYMRAATVVSPLAWGWNAFHDAFIREGTLRTPAGIIRSHRK